MQPTRRLWIAFALCVGCSPAPIVAGEPIETINPVIGDASFVSTFGRAPTSRDPATLRVQTHLAYVERLLRQRTGSAGLQAARRRVLDELRQYVTTAQFPAADQAAGLLPSFIDERGVRCAVAYLVEQDEGRELVQAIDRQYHHAYIAQIDVPALDAWAARSGFTRDELAMIQPAYPPVGPDIDIKVATDYRNAVSQDAAVGGLSHVASVEGGVRWNWRHNRWLGGPILGVDGGVGWVAHDSLAYQAYLRLGTRMTIYPGFSNARQPQLIGVVAGFGADAISMRIPRAWNVPVDAFLYLRASHRTRLGFIGGPRFRVAGADRGVGWRAGLDLVKRDVFWSMNPFAPRDISIGLGVERVADATFVGVTVALSTRGHFGFHGD